MDPFAGVPFIIKNTQSKFRFCSVVGGILKYTLDGKCYTGGPLITIYAIPGEHAEPASKLCKVYTRETESGMIDVQEKTLPVKKINGFEASVTEIYGTKKDLLQFVFIAVIKNKNIAIQLTGVATTDFAIYEKDFNAFTQTLKFK